MCLLYTTFLFPVITIQMTKGSNNEVMDAVDSLSGKELKVVIGAVMYFCINIYVTPAPISYMYILLNIQ